MATVNNKSTENAQNIHRNATENQRGRSEPPGPLRAKGQVAIPRARFTAARDRDDQPKDAGPWQRAETAQSPATTTRGRPAAAAVERFRVPFVRGFGYDDHPIVHRRIKS